MNERIRKLAEQAGFETDRGPLIGPTPYIKVGGLCVGVPLEKFAELLVEECVAQCWTVSESESRGSVVSECAKQIRKHFGVEQ